MSVPINSMEYYKEQEAGGIARWREDLTAYESKRYARFNKQDEDCDELVRFYHDYRQKFPKRPLPLALEADGRRSRIFWLWLVRAGRQFSAWCRGQHRKARYIEHLVHKAVLERRAFYFTAGQLDTVSGNEALSKTLRLELAVKEYAEGLTAHQRAVRIMRLNAPDCTRGLARALLNQLFEDTLARAPVDPSHEFKIAGVPAPSSDLSSKELKALEEAAMDRWHGDAQSSWQADFDTTTFPWDYSIEQKVWFYEAYREKFPRRPLSLAAQANGRSIRKFWLWLVQAIRWFWASCRGEHRKAAYFEYLAQPALSSRSLFYFIPDRPPWLGNDQIFEKNLRIQLAVKKHAQSLTAHQRAVRVAQLNDEACTLPLAKVLLKELYGDMLARAPVDSSHHFHIAGVPVPSFEWVDQSVLTAAFQAKEKTVLGVQKAFEEAWDTVDNALLKSQNAVLHAAYYKKIKNGSVDNVPEVIALKKQYRQALLKFSFDKQIGSDLLPESNDPNFQVCLSALQTLAHDVQPKLVENFNLFKSALAKIDAADFLETDLLPLIRTTVNEMQGYKTGPQPQEPPPTFQERLKEALEVVNKRHREEIARLREEHKVALGEAFQRGFRRGTDFEKGIVERARQRESVKNPVDAEQTKVPNLIDDALCDAPQLFSASPSSEVSPQSSDAEESASESSDSSSLSSHQEGEETTAFRSQCEEAEKAYQKKQEEYEEKQEKNEKKSKSEREKLQSALDTMRLENKKQKEGFAAFKLEQEKKQDGMMDLFRSELAALKARLPEEKAGPQSNQKDTAGANHEPTRSNTQASSTSHQEGEGVSSSSESESGYASTHMARHWAPLRRVNSLSSLEKADSSSAQAVCQPRARAGSL